MIWGVSLHGWEDLMRGSLLIVGVFGLIAGLSTWFVVNLQRAELAQSSKEFEGLKSANLALESQIAPRRLSRSDVSILKTAVAPFPGRQISVWSYGVDVEGRILAAQIKESLDEAHVPTVDSIGHMISSTTLRVGVIITGPDDELIKALMVALAPLSPTRGAMNNPGAHSVSGFDMLLGAPGIVPAEIFVGVKPLAP